MPVPGGERLTFFEDDEETLWGVDNGIYKMARIRPDSLKVTENEADGPSLERPSEH